jgi:hypothetical protein
MPNSLKQPLKILICGLGLLTAGCSAKTALSTDGSQVSITFPTAAQLSAGHARVQGLSVASGYDFTLACFAVNVTGQNIPSTTSGNCAIATGVFQGFVAPGGSLSITVPSGTARELDVFSFQRASSSDPCPTAGNLRGLDLTKIVRVGEIPSFDALSAVVNLSVDLVDPGTTANIITQYSMPNSCSASLVAGASRNGRFVCAATDAANTTSTKHMVGHASFVATAATSSGNKYKIQSLTRRISP